MFQSENDNEDYPRERKPITFNQFKSYCQKLVTSLNDLQTVEKQNLLSSKTTQKQVLSYKGSYKILNKKFATEHDCEYLQIQQLFETPFPQTAQSANKVISQKEQIKEKEQKQSASIQTKQQKIRKAKILLKINITYSLSYQIPLLLFMPYHVITSKQIKQSYDNQGEQQSLIQMRPFGKQEVFLVMNSIVASQKLKPTQEETGVFIVQNHINKEYFYTLHHCYMDSYQMDITQLIPYYLGLLGCHPQVSL